MVSVLYQIRCGRHAGVIEAKSPQDAWDKIVGNATDGFAQLARYRESRPAERFRCWRAGWSRWRYVAPEWFDRKRVVKRAEAQHKVAREWAENNQTKAEER